MIDLGKQKVEIECPLCQTKLTVSLQAVADEKSIMCTSCRQQVKLVDDKGSAKRAIQKTNKAIKELSTQLKSLGRK